MTQIERDSFCTIVRSLPMIANSLAEIAKQLKIANRINAQKTIAIYKNGFEPEFLKDILAKAEKNNTEQDNN